MRHILASVVLLVLLFPALALGGEITMDDLVVTNGLHYKKFTNVPFTGKVTGKEQGSLKNGKRIGVWIEYDRDGRIWKEVTYENGKKGTWVEYEHYKNGQLGSKGTYKDGKLDGPWVHYWKNGQLRSKGTYKDGKEDGPYVSYYDNGQLWDKGTYKDGKKDGPWVSYNKDGTVDEEWAGTFKDGEKVD